MPISEDSVIILFLLPIVAVVCISLNLFVRARGGRTFKLNLKGFGIDINIESKASEKNDIKHE